jgi:hypothetical protein
MDQLLTIFHESANIRHQRKDTPTLESCVSFVEIPLTRGNFMTSLAPRRPKQLERRTAQFLHQEIGKITLRVGQQSDWAHHRQLVSGVHG